MQSLKELYKVGIGPSSSHTIGPMRIAQRILKEYPEATHFHVALHGSLALTGKGHLTDWVMKKTFAPKPCDFSFYSEALPYHPNGMIIKVFKGDQVLDNVEAYSIGGGSIYFKGDQITKVKEVYPHHYMRDILNYLDEQALGLYDYIKLYEDEDIEEYLMMILDTMFETVETGLKKQGVIQGPLKLERVANAMYHQALNTHTKMRRDRLLIASYAYGVAEENADGGVIVTAPTCGASGVVPAVLYYAYKQMHMSKECLVQALAIGGLFGNIVKTNATISGADGGCQAEIGTACAMASAMMAWISELNNHLIAYAAEMGLEHNFGLTCDPVGGYVQIPCIERNAFAALRAVDAGMLAGELGYVRDNKISFDAAVNVQYATGKDLNAAYKETSLGGLAKEYSDHEN
jgi:L-serine dehydratase